MAYMNASLVQGDQGRSSESIYQDSLHVSKGVGIPEASDDKQRFFLSNQADGDLLRRCGRALRTTPSVAYHGYCCRTGMAYVKHVTASAEGCLSESILARSEIYDRLDLLGLPLASLHLNAFDNLGHCVFMSMLFLD